MQELSQVTEFGKILLFLILGIVLLSVTFGIGKLISLNKPNVEKNKSYECGEEPTGNSWLQFNSRFYVISLIFLLFDVELAFIFPWSTIFGNVQLLNADSRWGWLTLTEMFVFVGILILGLIYAWKKGDLDWIRPKPILPAVDSGIPASAYTNINDEVYRVRDFMPEAQADPKDSIETKKPGEIVAAKPAFKPAFRRPQS